MDTRFIEYGCCLCGMVTRTPVSFFRDHLHHVHKLSKRDINEATVEKFKFVENGRLIQVTRTFFHDDKPLFIVGCRYKNTDAPPVVWAPYRHDY